VAKKQIELIFGVPERIRIDIKWNIGVEWLLGLPVLAVCFPFGRNVTFVLNVTSLASAAILN
jgi:hypothetical protein